MLPSLVSSRVYAIDVGTDPRAPRMHKVVLKFCITEFLHIHVAISYPHKDLSWLINSL